MISTYRSGHPAGGLTGPGLNDGEPGIVFAGNVPVTVAAPRIERPRQHECEAAILQPMRAS